MPFTLKDTTDHPDTTLTNTVVSAPTVTNETAKSLPNSAVGLSYRSRSFIRWPILKPVIAGIISATLITLAAPPFEIWPLALVALLPLFWLLVQSSLGAAQQGVSVIPRPRPVRYAFMLGWWTGFCAVLGCSLWWVEVLSTFFHWPWLLSLFAATLIWAYQGLLLGVWCAVASWLYWRSHTGARPALNWFVVAPLTLVVVETFFPAIPFRWHLAILVWRAWPLTQLAELGGTSAVSALVVLINLVILSLLRLVLTIGKNRPAAKGPAEWEGRTSKDETKLNMLSRFWSGSNQGQGYKGLIGSIILILLVLSTSWWRVSTLNKTAASSPVLQVGLVQPNFGITSLKDREIHGADYLATLRKATGELAGQGAELVVWPESAFPYLFDRSLPAEYPSDHPWQLRPEGAQTRLLFGTLSHDFGANSQVYNSAVLIGQVGQVRGIYDKNRLFPFGEYIPLAAQFPDWATQMRQLLPDSPSVTPGVGPKVLTDGNLRIGTVICSEDMDEQLVQATARDKANPNLLGIINNDAWFGDTAAARQQLALASFGAIETRRYMVRATNTGVSAVLDPAGQVLVESPLYAVTRGEPGPAPTLLRGQVRLLDLFAVGPYLAGLFPYFCLVVLILSAAQPAALPVARAKQK